MRSHLLPTALAAVLITLPSIVASAKMSDRLAQKNVGTDDGAAPPGEYSGGELGWGEGTSDDAADVSEEGGDLLRGQAPDGGEGGDPVDGADPDPNDMANALAENGWPYGSSYRDMYVNRTTCTAICVGLGVGACAAATTGAVVAGIATLGSAALPLGVGAAVACGGLGLWQSDRCEALCNSMIH